MGTPEGDLLGGETERLLSSEEIRARFDEWKAKRKNGIEDEDTNVPVEGDDTQPLSKVEIAKKLFEGKASVVLRDAKMTAGYFCDLPEIRQAIWDMRKTIGKATADEILSDYFVENKETFT